MIKNKKADLPVIILVIGVVAICILTIFSFLKESEDLNEDFLGIGLIETANSIEEELKFYAANTKFKRDYGNEFKRGNDNSGKVVIEVKEDKIINASYIKNGKTFVWIKYRE